MDRCGMTTFNKEIRELLDNEFRHRNFTPDDIVKSCKNNVTRKYVLDLLNRFYK